MKVTEEIQRRLASAKRVILDNIGIGTGMRPTNSAQTKKDYSKPVVEVDINDLRHNKSTVQENGENSLINKS